MRKAIFPSFSTSLDSFGASEAQMSNSNSHSSGLLQDLHQSLAPLPSNRSLSWPHEFNYPAGGHEFVPTFYETPSITSFCTRNSQDQDVAENSQKRTGCSDINEQKSRFNVAKKRKNLVTEDPHCQGSQTPAMAQQPKAPVRRSQKLGDRVTALQQLVSPFGKTDTASVLQEATVYIKFLQEQIQVLSTPYFKVRSSTQTQVRNA